MPHGRVNGVDLYWEESGSGEPLVLVHGSWGDHDNWALVVPDLARTFRVVTYDRRGHSRSERPPGQGHVQEDVDDLAALVEHLGLAPAHLVGNSFGAGIVLRLAGQRPELFRTLVAHEPPLFGVLKGDPAAAAMLGAVQQRMEAVIRLLAAGDDEAGARLFVETIAFGEGAWERLPHAQRETFVRNAPTWLDETRDPLALEIDLAPLQRYRGPALLSQSDASAPFFPLVVERVAAALPQADRHTFHGSGHVPHATHPRDYVAVLTGWLAKQRG